MIQIKKTKKIAEKNKLIFLSVDYIIKKHKEYEIKTIKIFSEENEQLILDFQNYREPDVKKILSEIIKILSRFNNLIVGYNLKELFKILISFGFFLDNEIFDIKIAFYLLNPEKKIKSLEDLFQIYNFSEIKSNPDSFNNKFTYIYKQLDYRLRDLRLKKLYSDIEMPLVKLLAKMELKGINIDIEYLKNYLDKLNIQLKEIKNSIFNIVEKSFNLDSPKQVANLLFLDLNLPVIKKGKTGASTDVEVLTKLSKMHPLPGKILEYRTLQKLKSGFVDKIYKLASKNQGRIYTNFQQNIASTGRIVSVNPNIQNIPVKSEIGRELRKVFISESQSFLISADYSQIELRVLAHFSNDENLITSFKQDKDIHAFTASMIFNIDVKSITPKMRNIAKTVNFGIVYGISPFGLSKQLNISIEESKEFIDKYFKIYPQVSEFIKNQKKKAKDNEYVTTILGRKRYITKGFFKKKNPYQDYLLRIAVNTPIQGSVADMIKLAMVNIDRDFQSLNIKSYISLQIHDELILNVYRKEKERVLGILKNRMENSIKLSVPIKVDIKEGKNWLDMKKVKLN